MLVSRYLAVRACERVIRLNPLNIVCTINYCISIGFIAATPAEVIDHYYCFLADNLDSSTVCQTMLKLEVITEGDVVDSAKMCSDYQHNAFLLDKLLMTDKSNIIRYCRMLQSTENEKEIGKMLMNGENTEINLLPKPNCHF